MKTILATFKTNGKTIKRRAILNDNLSELSKSKKNQCSDIIDETKYFGYWSLIFIESDTIQYEVELEYDRKKWHKTLKPIKCVVWDNDLVKDAVIVTIKVS